MTTPQESTVEGLDSIETPIVSPAANGGEVRILQTVLITPGTTSQDICDQIGLDSTEYMLGTLANKQFAPFDVVYPFVAPGDKLYMTPRAKAGAPAPAPRPGRDVSPWTRLQTYVSGRLQNARASSPILIKPNVRPVWQQRGWKEVAPGIFIGYYATPFGSRKGRVEFSPDGVFWRLLIWDIPPEFQLSGHPHAVCVTKVDGNVFEIHQNVPPTSIDSAIFSTEILLHEAHDLLRQRSEPKFRPRRVYDATFSK